ncbi:hypothetical protein BD311DRAFT_760560 [Dichomitus squalens]|uniref:Uncharacterized protein n=1 Tax=Dichomitus squalens TaxID=114155 RepID=A0A4Q9MLZ6_9APHY|nr:hypothetical protein BD311DRAFT_760560 [Dichomitus squalens]TBU55087.1 hypothetical protein BD310DRAFT_934411 [Dichomitus squalens]
MQCQWRAHWQGPKRSLLSYVVLAGYSCQFAISIHQRKQQRARVHATFELETDSVLPYCLV